MCFESTTIYGCGHRSIVVDPCGYEGTGLCHHHPLPVQEMNGCCSPACAGPDVGVWTAQLPACHGPDVSAHHAPPSNGWLLNSPHPAVAGAGTEEHPFSHGSDRQHSAQRPAFKNGAGLLDASDAEERDLGFPVLEPELTSPDRSRAPVAPMSVGGFESPATMHKHTQSDKADVDDAENSHEHGEFYGKGFGGNTLEAVNNSSSGSSATLVNGGSENGMGGRGCDDAAHFYGSDGVISLPSAPHNSPIYDRYGRVTNGVDIENSLRIDPEDGSFHLGPQWQVPSASTAIANAGPTTGIASIWSEHGRAIPSRKEEALAAGLRVMGIKNQGQHSKPSATHNHGQAAGGSWSYWDLDQYQTPARSFARAHGNYHSTTRPGMMEGSPKFEVVEDPTNVDLSMSGAL
ncbi:hypothetical protein SAMD00023353_0302080 [Rosellinia necatrix]|uniref:Uncharacterized protein n=1 Tax=Rosellinia necatrix TaxID=77044 RepID=A0A1W2TDL3_ROSNE|nr:hypothetical protein SAMD00023353_0302080 [Rosellinia necatrix]